MAAGLPAPRVAGKRSVGLTKAYGLLPGPVQVGRVLQEEAAEARYAINKSLRPNDRGLSIGNQIVD